MGGMCEFRNAKVPPSALPIVYMAQAHIVF